MGFVLGLALFLFHANPMEMIRFEDDADEVDPIMQDASKAVSLPDHSTSGFGMHDFMGHPGDLAADISSHDAMGQREDFKTKLPLASQQDADDSLGARAAPRQALFEVNATSFTSRSDKAIVVTTFKVENVPGSGGEVFLDLNQDLAYIGTPMLSKEILKTVASRLEVTASIFVGPTKEKAEVGSGYPVRWFSSSGTEYVVCGHGNLATGLLAARNGVLLPAQSGEPQIPGGFSLLQALGNKELYEVNVKDTDRLTYADVEVNMGPAKLYQEKISGTFDASISFHSKLANMLGTTDSNIEKGMVSVEDDKNAMALIFFVHDLDSLSAPNTYDDAGVFTSPQSSKPYRGLLAVTRSRNSFTYRAFYPFLGLPEDKATGSANAFITVASCRNFGACGPFTSQQRKGGQATGAFTSRIGDDGVFVGGRVEMLHEYRAVYDEEGGVSISLAD